MYGPVGGGSLRGSIKRLTEIRNFFPGAIDGEKVPPKGQKGVTGGTFLRGHCFFRWVFVFFAFEAPRTI